MNQNTEPFPEIIDLEKVMDAITPNGSYAFIPRDGKEGVYTLSIAKYHEEIEAYRLEQAEQEPAANR